MVSISRDPSQPFLQLFLFRLAPPPSKKLMTKSELKIKEYVCKVSYKSLENCVLELTDRQTSDKKLKSIFR